MTCKEAGCAKKVQAREMCSMHWSRWRRALSESPRPVRTPKEYLTSLLTVQYHPDSLLDTPCHLALDQRLMPNGYARASIDGHRDYLHRHVWRVFQGPIPDGFEVDHGCNVRHCGNIDHLEAVTRAVNNDRKYARKPITRCPQEHEYTPENTWIDSDGWRHCKTCNRDRARARYRATRRAA